MRRLALIALSLIAAAAGVASFAGADDSHTYHLQLYNAFGLVPGSDVRIAGVNAGSVSDEEIAVTPGGAKVADLEIETSGALGVLGKETRCSSEPQSLIAEYFLTCTPKGPPLPDGATLPPSRTRLTVQSDLVQNTLREPFKDRLALLINEFGTALAGNPHELNQAIRLGAPALTQLRRALDILASENRTIRDLNADSDRIISQLAARRTDVVSFIQRARDVSAISATRRHDLATNFDRLDDFLGQLHPTLVKLGDVAAQQKPLLSDLRLAAPGLNQLAVNLPPFNSATQRSLESLGRAAAPGREAFQEGRDELQALADSGRHAPATASQLSKLLVDLDSRKRAVEPDPRSPGGKGFTGFENLINYFYYQPGALNQFDEIGHFLHYSVFEPTSPCASYNTAQAGETGHGGQPGVPAKGGGFTTDSAQRARCVSWVGAHQPGITEPDQFPPYDPSVCPNGSTRPDLCNPSGSTRAHGRGAQAGSPSARRHGGRGGGGGPGAAPGLPALPGQPPGNASDLPRQLQDVLGGGGHGGGKPLPDLGLGGGGHSGPGDAQALLDLLFGN